MLPIAYCVNVVDPVLRGTDLDITPGAHYYDSPNTATSGWFQRVIVNDPAKHPLIREDSREA